MTRKTLMATILVAGAFLAGNLTAQTAYVLSATNETVPIYLPSAAYPGGGASPLPPLPLPQVAATPGIAAFPTGGHAIDQTTQKVYSTKGGGIVEEPLPLYPTPFVPLPPVPLGGTLLTGGPLTGLAVDATNGILYICDQGSFQARSIVHPYPAVGPVLSLAVLMASQISGMGFEPGNAAFAPSLWFCDVQGVIYHLTTGGIPIGPQPVNFVPTFSPPQGLTVNQCNGTGSFPAPSCSAQLPGYHITITDGANIYDALNTFAVSPPIPIPGIGGALVNALGLAFSSDGQLSGATPCAGRIRLSRPAHNGAGFAPCSIELRNAPPFQTAVLVYDRCPSGPTFLPWGGFICFGAGGSPGTLSLMTDATGRASISVPFAFAPAGVQFTVAWVYTDPGAPFGLCHTKCLTVTSSLRP